MKKVIQNIANHLGYKISRLNRRMDPFYEMQRLTKNVCQPTICDVGAHYGQTAKKFRRLIPESVIIALEPFPKSFEILKKNTADDHNIKIYNYGLSDQDAGMAFHSNPSSATNSLLASDVKATATWGEGLLETNEIIVANFRTLDSFMRELQIPKIHILKLDVQGVEYLVMKGGISSFDKKKVDLIYTEIIIQPTYQNQKRFDQVLTLFYDSGFDLHSIYNLGLTKDGKLRQVDAIFTRLGGDMNIKINA